MGLDQYAYVAERAGTEYDDSGRQELAYWRKHPNLQGWMRQLWENRERPAPENDPAGTFNGVELELEWRDIEQLEEAVSQGTLPATTGFFFGNNSDEHYREQDLEFCRRARSELFFKRRVFYNSSW